MKIAITGAKGQLGREWVSYLHRKGVWHQAYGSGELDITDREEIGRQLGKSNPTCVINCAAFTGVDQAEDHPDKADLVNHLGVKYLSEWCHAHEVPIIHFSTDYVFPGLECDKLRYPDGYFEDSFKQPVNEYGRSKLAGEQALAASGADFLLIRVSWLCGRFGKNFVKTMLRLGVDQKRIKVVNDQWGSPTFTDQVTKHVFRLLKSGEKGVYHLSSGAMISWYEFATEIFRQSGLSPELKPVTSEEFEMKARRPYFSKLNHSKISRTLNVEMEYWKSGLSRLLNQLNSVNDYDS